MIMNYKIERYAVAHSSQPYNVYATACVSRGRKSPFPLLWLVILCNSLYYRTSHDRRLNVYFVFSPAVFLKIDEAQLSQTYVTLVTI